MPGPGAAAGAKAASTASGRLSAGVASRSGSARAAKVGAASRGTGGAGARGGAAARRSGGGTASGGGRNFGRRGGSSSGLGSIRPRRSNKDEGGGEAQRGSTTSKVVALAAGSMLFFVVVVISPLLIMASSTSSCSEGDTAVPIQTNHQTEPEGMSETQVEIRIYLVGRVMNMTPRQIVTAYATGFVETHMQNLHWGGETSRGVFQQRDFSPWTDGGRNRENVIDASISFFLRLRELDHGQPIGELAQDVQVSAYPERYYQWVSEGSNVYNRISQLVGTPAGAKTIKDLQGVSISGGGLGGCMLTGSGEYINPFQGQEWEPGRTDQGVDYSTSHDYPIRAIGDARMMGIGDWGKYGPFAWYKLLDGPQAGHCVFVAEGIQNIRPAGTEVKAGQPVAESIGGYKYSIETGWAQGDATPSTPYNGEEDGTPMPGGKAFNRFLLSLGAKTRDHWGPGPLYAGASC